MEVIVHRDKVFWLLDVLLARWKSKPKQYPYNRPDAVIPQRIIPRELRANKETLACWYFYACIYMRGGIESLQAFNALIRMWRDLPHLFDPAHAALMQPRDIQQVLKKYIGWDSEAASINWVFNSRWLMQAWKGNPLNLIKGVRSCEEAERRIRNKLTKRELREAGVDGAGFRGFQPKMVSMILYFYDWEGWLRPRFYYPSPADFHNFRMGLAIGAIEVQLNLEEKTRQDIEIERNEFPELGFQLGDYYVRATEKLSKPWRDAVMEYLRTREADPVELSDAIWLYSLVLCGNSPATTTKPPPSKEEAPDKFWSNGERKPKQLSFLRDPHLGEVWDHGTWVAAKKSKGLEQTCFVCTFAQECKVAVPAAPYYKKGKLIFNRDHPMLKMNIPFGSYREPTPNAVLVEQEVQELLHLNHPIAAE